MGESRNRDGAQLGSVASVSDQDSRTRFRISGMDCASCATKIEKAVRRLPGVSEVAVSVPAETLLVSYPHTLASAAIVDQVEALGYSVRGSEDLPQAGAPSLKFSSPTSGGGPKGQSALEHAHLHEHGPSEGVWWRSRKAVLTIFCGIALAAAYIVGQVVPAIGSYAFLAAMTVGLAPIAQRAYQAARVGTPFSIETLMTIAAVGAVIIGATEEAAAVVFLFLVGELLEGVAAGRARASIRALTDLVPKTALLEREEDRPPEETPAEALAVDDVIVVRPGDRAPADGVILSGGSHLDEAPVTGESAPKYKGPGDKIFAGTINAEGALRVRVTAAAQDNTIARVVRLVEEAQEAKAPTQRFIDRFSSYYTPGVLVTGALVAVVPPLLFGAAWSEWVYKGLAILLIGCPCALVISTPAAVAAGLSAGARRGLLLKGGAVLETMGRVTAAAFDKTGTLTAGKPQVTDVVGLGRTEKDVISLSAGLEAGSSHPLAVAILSHAKEEGALVLPATEVKAVAGKGLTGFIRGESLFLGSPQAAAEIAHLSSDVRERVSALNDEGKTVSVLLAGEKVAGLIAMRDEPRPDAEAGIQALKAAGIASFMLTGDNKRTAAAIAGRLGIEARGELLPDDKLAIVRKLQSEGAVVAKIGDGINDAPALAGADVGIAMGGGTDVALETADAASLHGRVTDVARMVKLSRKTMANIHQNIAVALGLKAVFLVTTILGVTGLWPAILADTGATVLVTANAMRLLGAGRDL